MPSSNHQLLVADTHSSALHHMCAWAHGHRACMMYNHTKMVNDGRFTLHVNMVTWALPIEAMLNCSRMHRHCNTLCHGCQ